MQPANESSPKTSGECSNRWRATWQSSASPLGRDGSEDTRATYRSDHCASLETLDKEKIKSPWTPHDLLIPIRPIRFFPERADHSILETIEIATEGEDCDECVRKLRPVLKNIPGVNDVKVDLEHERVIVTFDARKTHVPDLHDAILKSGYKPAPVAD